MSFLTVILAALICGLLPLGITVRIVRRCRNSSAVFVLAFVIQFTLALIAAWLVGVGFDVVGLPMYAPPPKPGNFTLPLPWTYLLPSFQAATFGPVTGLLVGVWAKCRSRKPIQQEIPSA